MIRKLGLVLVVPLALGACGETKEERGVTGAGLGAAAGAMIGAVTGLSVLEGAIIGTGVGGAAGLLTDKDDIDIGDPVWKDGESEGQAQAGGSGPQTASTDGGYSPLVMEIQSGLSRLGYKPGPADGLMGPQTQSAIRSYQSDHALSVDGRASPALRSHIQSRLDGT